ncbi:MAG: SRPBCC domain-containing protein [Bacteroidota bacterium]
MSQTIKTQIIIQATPEKVWQMLTNFENYPLWNPFIKSISGDKTVGAILEARIEPPGASGMTFKPKVLAFTPNKEFRWLGHFIIPGLFDGEHQFIITDNGDGSITFQQNENFKGLLVPFFKKLLSQNTPEGFRQMNEALKSIVESK